MGTGRLFWPAERRCSKRLSSGGGGTTRRSEAPSNEEFLHPILPNLEVSRIADIQQALTHDIRLNSGKYDRNQVLPVTWHGKTIEATMEGEAVPVSFFGYHDMVVLWEEIQ